MLSNQYLFDANKVTITQVVANLGACTGGVVVGYSSQIFGRRFMIILVCILEGALLYPYSFVGTNAVMAAAFFEQFMVQGAWGVIPWVKTLTNFQAFVLNPLTGSTLASCPHKPSESLWLGRHINSEAWQRLLVQPSNRLLGRDFHCPLSKWGRQLLLGINMALSSVFSWLA